MTRGTDKTEPDGGGVPPVVEWLVLLAVAGAAAAGLVRAQYGPGHGREVAAGWAVTAAYAAAVAAINRRAVGGTMAQTLVWGVGLKAAGLGGLLAAVLIVWKMSDLHVYSFVFTVLLGFVAVLAGEIRGLWRLTNRRGKT